ncbi:MAG TPA: DUF4159 domain-containing protein, partial [Tepidisphaeraceae bacterium]|nr:DUF4159 domain-containing protein [Tepidisphaeraceae bacterium]
PGGWTDRSNSQYGVLGMWALSRAGGEVPNLYWELVDAAWKKAQHPDGSWDYQTGGPFQPGISMTTAGVATLFITQDYTLNENWGICRGGVKNLYIERGLQYMDNHINEALNGSLYVMYGVERIGTASGRKFFGSRDWYQIGADHLVKTQKPDGSWVADHGAIPDTSFGLLFLSRGRASVIMNKLEYASDKAQRWMADIWDERPRDVANLAQWVGEQQEAYFNWQIVNLQVPADQLHDAPILYISGSQPLDFKPDEVSKLRDFVQQGGMIFANADCAKREFAASFEKLGKELFPKYAFHPVGADDLLWKEQFTRWRVKPKVTELTNGVRKLMVLVPDTDPSRAWQTRSDRTKESMYQLGANLFLYAVDKKNSLKKDQTYIVRPDLAIKPKTTLKVARLDIGENPDPEPGGWPRMAALMHNQFKIDLKVDIIKPDALAGYQVADLTGTTALQLSPDVRTSLKQFVEKGGTLVIDAAGGNPAFADTARAELANIFGPGALKPVPDDFMIYDQPDGKPLKISWRSFALDHIADRKRGHIDGITFGKRIGVFFSREDLSAGLVGEPVDGIIGYTPETATDLMTGILRYVAGDTEKPKTPVKAPVKGK